MNLNRLRHPRYRVGELTGTLPNCELDTDGGGGTTYSAYDMLDYRSLGAGLFTHPFHTIAFGDSATWVLNHLRAIPYPVTKRQTVTGLGFYQYAEGPADSQVRIGIWNDVGGDAHRPSTLVAQGYIDGSVAGAGAREDTSVSVVLDPGLYWISYLCGGTQTPTIGGVDGVDVFPILNAGFVGAADFKLMGFYHEYTTCESLAATFPYSASDVLACNNGFPAVILRVS